MSLTILVSRPFRCCNPTLRTHTKDKYITYEPIDVCSKLFLGDFTSILLYLINFTNYDIFIIRIII